VTAPLTEHLADKLRATIAMNSWHTLDLGFGGKIDVVAVALPEKPSSDAEKALMGSLNQYAALIHLEEWLHVYQATLGGTANQNGKEALSNAVIRTGQDLDELNEFDVALFMQEQGLVLPKEFLATYSRGKVLMELGKR
jgi:hypothetical protein